MMSFQKKIAILFVLVWIIFSGVAVLAAQNNQNTEEVSEEGINILYRTHIQDKGWETVWKKNGELSGTVGEWKRLEAIQIKLSGAYPADATIDTVVHVENEGDLGPFEMAMSAGTEGKSQRLERIMFDLKNLPGYTVKYNVQVENKGWLRDPNDVSSWFNNQESAGTTGEGLRLEGITIKLIKNSVDLSAYQQVLSQVSEKNFTQASWELYQKILKNNQVDDTNTQQEIDLATSVIKSAQADLIHIPEILSVTAIAQKTIEISGNHLKELRKNDIEVAGNVIDSWNINEEGTRGIIYTQADLPPGEDVQVLTTIENKRSEYHINYIIQANSISIRPYTYDDDLSNQRLELSVNGVETSADYLKLSGYDLTFNAWHNGNDANIEFFGVASNDDGRLNQSGFSEEKNYLVEVILRKDQNILVSERSNILVTNINSSDEAIDQVEFHRVMSNLKEINDLSVIKGELVYISKVLLEGDDYPEIWIDCYQVSTVTPEIVKVEKKTHSQKYEVIGVAEGLGQIEVKVGKFTKIIAVEVK